MNTDFAAAMRRATEATRACDVAQATSIIQTALAGRGAPQADAARGRPATSAPARLLARPLDGEILEAAAEPGAASRTTGAGARRRRRPLGEVVRTLRDGRLRQRLPGAAGRAPTPPVPEGAEFRAESFACSAGTRSFRLYVPASAPHGPTGLVVMLHGCTQSPEDFAVGTGMNALAETHRLLVAYPEQTSAHNAMSCWNWFRPGDQRRGAGEPAILAGLTARIVAEFGIPRGRVFVAGLSAGGAMAAVMGETYPEIYAAVGIHSGLAHGSASDVVSALAAMRGDAAGAVPRGAPPCGPAPRVIVFHGSADRTVHPVNAERIVAAARGAAIPEPSWSEHRSAGAGRSYRRSTAKRRDGTSGIESWLIDGAGHAWAGGSPRGSYTDPSGPDASAEMVRFFLAAARDAAA